MKKGLVTVLLGVYVMSAVFFYDHMPADYRRKGILGGGAEKIKLTASDFGVMCISSAYPGLYRQFADSRDNESQQEEAEAVTLQSSSSSEDSPQLITSDYKTDTGPVIFGDEPAVLIVHTHATESYLPASSGNYHTTGPENSVREVGDVLAQTLEKQGIPVIHDQTLHDSPSYSQSYSRSYETTKKILEKYPTVRCVIDLHRDAVSADGPAAVVTSGGKNCAKYSFVVSNAVENYSSNLKFVKNLNKTASEKYGGFTGKILERGYRYNQNLSDKYLLLEIGYNRNDISEARNTAEIFGRILADTLRQQ